METTARDEAWRRLGGGAGARVEEVATVGIMGRGHEEGEVKTDGEQDVVEECSRWRGCVGGRRRERGNDRAELETGGSMHRG